MSDSKDKLDVLSLLPREVVYQAIVKRSDEIQGRNPDPRDAEIARLRAENEQLRQERDSVSRAHNELHLQSAKDALQKYEVCFAALVETRAQLAAAQKGGGV